MIGEGWLWLGGSLLGAILATQAAWHLERREWGVALRLRNPTYRPFLLLARTLFYLGVPAAALLWGRDAVILRLMGFQPLLALAGGDVPPGEVAGNLADWARDVGWAAGLGAATWALYSLIRWAVGRTQAADPVPLHPLRAFWEATLHEVHWAFYRNAFLVALGVYWGAWASLGTVALEAMANPYWRAALRRPGDALPTLLRAGLAALSAVLFLQTQNLWLAILTHWLVWWGQERLGRRG